MKNPLRAWVAAAYRWCAYPHRFVPFRGVLRRPGARILDVGCGNHSPTVTKQYFPYCRYEGVDRERWNRDERDDAVMDAFHEIDLDRQELLAALPSAAYDLVICSHVLEHLRDPWAVIPELARTVKPGGFLYIEVPSERSLRLPRARTGFFGIRGCLHFEDDPTHRGLVSPARAAELLDQAGLRVIRCGKRFLLRRVILLPLYAAAGLALRGYIPASVVWDVLGFADVLVAQRPATLVGTAARGADFDTPNLAGFHGGAPDASGKAA
ncbi:MAG: class I SAM-dependent methyltransferase [Thermogutta sp.]